MDQVAATQESEQSRFVAHKEHLLVLANKEGKG